MRVPVLSAVLVVGAATFFATPTWAKPKDKNPARSESTRDDRADTSERGEKANQANRGSKGRKAKGATAQDSDERVRELERENAALRKQAAASGASKGASKAGAGHAAAADLPLGLARQAEEGRLPPGIAKKLEAGDLPPGLAKGHRAKGEGGQDKADGGAKVNKEQQEKKERKGKRDNDED
jgi:hypothetical protein